MNFPDRDFFLLSYGKAVACSRNQAIFLISGWCCTLLPNAASCTHSALIYISSILIHQIGLHSCSCSVAKLCPTLWPHELQHIRLPCPSLCPGVCSNSGPLSQWCHPTISSSVTPFSSCPQSFPASGFFQWVGSLHQVAKVLEFQLQHQSFQWIFRVDFLQD